jgi:tripartite-type tricarboxylate transporter receptor subunit TctC
MSRGLQGALTTACGLLILLGAFAASAQDYPARTVRIVVPYAPGGVSDIAARVIGGKLAELWKQPVVVENRTGGGGVVGTSAVAKSAPDGHTLLIATVAEFSLLQHLYPNLSFNAQRDFAPILILTDTPQMWAAAANAPFSSVQEMIAYAKSRPEGLAFASPGNGTLNHLVGERFALETGIKLVHVPYKGGAPAATALASGEVPVGMVAATAVAPHIKSGRVKAIAVTTAHSAGPGVADGRPRRNAAGRHREGERRCECGSQAGRRARSPFVHRHVPGRFHSGGAGRENARGVGALRPGHREDQA